MTGEEVFDCRMCGHCCEGAGGIIVSPDDLVRICEYLNVSSEEFSNKYGIVRNEKLTVRTGDDGFCIFFVQDKGCSVHEGKPNICRAWPYFRGNMIDEDSLFLAKDFCPGINPEVAHKDFVQAGEDYLQKNNLIANDAKTQARALIK